MTKTVTPRTVPPAVLVLALVAAYTVPGTAAETSKPIPFALQTPRLFATLPDDCPTPDGMAIVPDNGDLVVACPNYGDQTKPACLLRIGRDRKVRMWVKVPPLPETGVACPMGIAFGPDGDLYVCDNQGWKGEPKGQFKGRVLRLRIKGDKVEFCTVVAEGMEHPNGVRVRGGFLYVTESLMTKVKDPSGLLVSSVYRFKVDDKNVKVANTLEDKQVIATFLTQNRFCQYGADGIVFDGKGNLYIGNFGDGAIHKLTLDAAGKVTSNTIFARTDLDYSLDPQSPGFLTKATAARMRTTDGICVDDQDNIYVADFSNNAIAKVTPAGAISVLAQNGDTDGRSGELDQPGEPIVWNGRLIVTCFDMVAGPDKVNTKHDKPYTISELSLTGQASEISVGSAHPFICTDYTQGKVFIVSREGKVEWEYPATNCNDVWVLPNGNLLFNTGKGIKEVTRDKKVVFEYQSQSEIYACQRLPDGNTFIGECNAGRLLEVDPSGKIVKEIRLLSEGKDGGHAYMRNARRLDNGNYLVAHFGQRVVREYDAQGNVVREIPAAGGPHSVVRLANGNTLVSCGDGKGGPKVFEVDKDGKTVWQVQGDELPGVSMKFMCGLQRLPNGNTVMTNWLGHNQFGAAPHVIEVTPDKQVVWTFADHKTMRTISSIQLLDVPGDVTRGQILH